MSKIETTILRNLLHTESYLRKVLPFLKGEYFANHHERLLLEDIQRFVEQFKNPPTVESLQIRYQGNRELTEDDCHELDAILVELGKDTPVDQEWLITTTEKFCKDKAVVNAIYRAIAIADGREKAVSPVAIPGVLQEALSVCFDNSVGHDYLDDKDERHAFYNHTEERIPFDLDIMNKITQGGVPRKTLNVILAGVGVGKSLSLCHLASSYLTQGKNVLYITMEMAEKEIAKRIDANLMDVPMDDLKDLPYQMFADRVDRIRNRSEGHLIVKEYPTASAHTGHFRALLSELEVKKNFRPDVIIVDYINICASSRFKMSGNINTYVYVKAIAEELRGLAMEFNVPLWTATQLNRAGFASSDVEMTDVAESFGLPATADFMISLFMDETLEKLGQYVIKQLKNRYNDPSYHRRFVVGVDKPKMRLYNVDPSAQRDILSEEGEPPVIATSNRLDDKNFGLLQT